MMGRDAWKVIQSVNPTFHIKLNESLLKYKCHLRIHTCFSIFGGLWQLEEIWPKYLKSWADYEYSVDFLLVSGIPCSIIPQ